MEQSIERSEEQADIIKSIAIPIMLLDVEYCKQAAKDMRDQASRQESMAILNPSYPQAKNDILRLKGSNHHKSTIEAEMLMIPRMPPFWQTPVISSLSFSQIINF